MAVRHLSAASENPLEAGTPFINAKAMGLATSARLGAGGCRSPHWPAGSGEGADVLRSAGAQRTAREVRAGKRAAKRGHELLRNAPLGMIYGGYMGPLTSGRGAPL